MKGRPRFNSLAALWHAEAFLYPLLRRGRFVSHDDLTLFAHAEDNERISEAESLAVRQVAMIAQGVQGRGTSQRDVLIVVELSATIESGDIDRVADAARILRHVGYEHVFPVVVGAYINDENLRHAKTRNVEVRIDRMDTDPIPDM